MGVILDFLREGATNYVPPTNTVVVLVGGGGSNSYSSSSIAYIYSRVCKKTTKSQIEVAQYIFPLRMII